MVTNLTERLIDKLIEYLKHAQGKIVHLKDIRTDLKIEPGSNDDANLRAQMSSTLVEKKIVSPSGKSDGAYKVILQIKPVVVFMQRERRPPFDLVFPRDFNMMDQMGFASSIVIREGDLILISGVSNFGKTTLCLNFCAENIDKHPVLMGNEYTTFVENEYVPSPRFLTRLDAMDSIKWVDENGNERFTLLPVREDYAEHIVKDKINIIDWINIDTGEHYMIGTILEKIKRNLGRGIAIVAIQKAEGTNAGRGGQFTKDFADLELLIDRFGKSDVLLTIGKVKEYTSAVIGTTYAYSIDQGVKITNFREVKKCPECHGQGFAKSGECDNCHGTKYIDVEDHL